VFATLRQQLAPRLLPQLFQDVHVLVEMFGSPAHTGMRDLSQPRVAMASVKSRNAFTDNSRKTLGLYPSRDFPARLHRVCLVPNRPRVLRESAANRWKIGQENSLGQASVRLPICELPGNCARIYFSLKALTGLEGARFSDLEQLFACAKFRRALTEGL